METILPFRHEDEKTLLNEVHPLVRMILPFIFVIPFLLIDNIYLISTFILITFFFSVIAHLPLLRIISRLKNIIPFIILITIFIPFYIGETIVLRIEIGITIYIYLYYLALRSGWELFRTSKEGPLKGLGLGFTACVITNMAANVTHDNWSYLNLMCFYWVFLALVIRAKKIIELGEIP